MIPHNFKLVYDADSIGLRVRELARDITAWADAVTNGTGADIVSVPVLRGALFFFADLLREVRASAEVSPVKTWGYEEGINSKELETLRLDLGGADVTGRSVLMVDDICDTGRTLSVLKEKFLAAGAKEVRSAVLIRRIVKKPLFVPDYVAFEYTGEEWFVGYGMEDRNRWRNLPDVYVLSRES